MIELVESADGTAIEELILPGALPTGRIKRVLASTLNPGLVVPLIFGLGLLTAVLAFGNPGRTWNLMVQVGWQSIVLVLVLTLPYLAARGFVWRQLLVRGGVQLSWRPLLLAFASGEFAKNLPGGVYLEDYLLARNGVPVSTSFAATTAVSAVEVLPIVPLLLGWGIPGWSWLVPALSALLLCYLAGLGVLWWLINPTGRDTRLRLPQPLAPVVRGLRAVMLAARPLVSLRTIRATLLPTTLYLGIVALDLVILGRAVGFHRFDLQEAATVYGFATLVLVLVPLPTDLGVTEVSGAGAMLAFGATTTQATAALLLLRVVLTGATMLMTGLVVFLLWRGGAGKASCFRPPRSVHAHERRSPTPPVFAASDCPPVNVPPAA